MNNLEGNTYSDSSLVKSIKSTIKEDKLPITAHCIEDTENAFQNANVSQTNTDQSSLVNHSNAIQNGIATKSEKPVSADSGNSTEFCTTCLFCKKRFETLENLNTHECKKYKCESIDKLLKCQFCSMTFTQEHHLNTHIECHKKNNCTICDSQFTKRKAVVKHLKREHNIVELSEKLHPCTFCDKRFSKRLALNLHLKTHANCKHFCEMCGFMCDDDEAYQKHVEEHEKNSKHECHLCSKKFVRRQQYDQHIMAHDRYKCSICVITFDNKKLFLKHQTFVHNILAEKKTHTCLVCEKSFSRPKLLEVHQKIHIGEKPSKCLHCEKHFYDERRLAKHMKSIKHLKCVQVQVDAGKTVEIEKPYSCSVCGIAFYQQKSLRRHMEIIHCEREFQKCPYCDYKSKYKTNIKRHIKTHTEPKHFICKQCDSSFHEFANLKEHVAFVHSENRNFICETCNKSFKNRSTLQRHMRIHNEKRPFKCFCNKDYKRMSHLKRHFTSAHHITFRRNQMHIAKENTNFDTNWSSEKIAALFKSLNDMPDESSCDDIVSSGMCSNPEFIHSNITETSQKEQSAVSLNDISRDVPLKSQNFTDKCDSNEFFNSCKSNLIVCESKMSSICMLPNSLTPSVSLDDPILNVSPSSYCNISLPSSPFNMITAERESAKQPSTESQDTLSMSFGNTFRPHSLPNIYSQLGASEIQNLSTIALPDADFFPFPFNSDIMSSSHLNVEQNSSLKQLFGDQEDVFSISSNMVNYRFEADCSPEHFMNATNEAVLWGIDDNRIKIENDLAVTSIYANASTSAGLTTNVDMLPQHLFSSDSLMTCQLNATGSEFGSLLDT